MNVRFGRSARVAMSVTAASLTLAPAAQACIVRPPSQPADPCKNAQAAGDLLARYGSLLSAAQRQAASSALDAYTAANCGGASAGGGTV